MRLTDEQASHTVRETAKIAMRNLPDDQQTEQVWDALRYAAATAIGSTEAHLSIQAANS